MLRPLIVSTLALAAMNSTPASAQEQVWAAGDGYLVRTGDLDLTSAKGRAAMLRRVETAARDICRDAAPRIKRDACTRDAIERALGVRPQTSGVRVAAAR